MRANPKLKLEPESTSLALRSAEVLVAALLNAAADTSVPLDYWFGPESPVPVTSPTVRRSVLERLIDLGIYIDIEDGQMSAAPTEVRAEDISLAEALAYSRLPRGMAAIWRGAVRQDPDLPSRLRDRRLRSIGRRANPRTRQKPEETGDVTYYAEALATLMMRHGDEGVGVDDFQEEFGIDARTLSRVLKHLQANGWDVSRRRKKIVAPDYGTRAEDLSLAEAIALTGISDGRASLLEAIVKFSPVVARRYRDARRVPADPARPSRVRRAQRLANRLV